MWNWTEKEAARNFGIVLGVGGIMALLTYLTVAFKLGKM